MSKELNYLKGITSLQVILERQRFATVISSGMEVSWELAAGSELLQQLVLQCTSFQACIPAEKSCSILSVRRFPGFTSRAAVSPQPQGVALLVSQRCTCHVRYVQTGWEGCSFPGAEAILPSQGVKDIYLQVLDRLCASHLYRQALICENRASTVTSPQTALQIAIVVQNAFHELPASLKEALPSEARSPSKPQPSSPTAAQRLAKLSANSQLALGPAHSTTSIKKHAHKRKKVTLQLFLFKVFSSTLELACGEQDLEICLEQADWCISSLSSV